MTADVLSLMDRLGLARADVVGLGHRANTALILAIQHPRRVHRVVVSDAALDLGAVACRFTENPRLATVMGMQATAKFQELSPQAPSLVSSVTREQLQSISTPVLILDAAGDELDCGNQARLLAQVIPGAVLAELPSATGWEQHEAVARIVREFLDA
jgi:pimeloyl-ACP methyl ester carboxylesterase